MVGSSRWVAGGGQSLGGGVRLLGREVHSWGGRVQSLGGGSSRRGPSRWVAGPTRGVRTEQSRVEQGTAGFDNYHKQLTSTKTKHGKATKEALLPPAPKIELATVVRL